MNTKVSNKELYQSGKRTELDRIKYLESKGLNTFQISFVLKKDLKQLKLYSRNCGGSRFGVNFSNGAKSTIMNYFKKKFSKKFK